MPFTFSHPAIVLPLSKVSRNWFSLTGLVIGSMTPDLEYPIREDSSTWVSHTLPGLFWFDLPLGLVLTFVFHDVIRNRLYDNLPIFLKRRVWPFRTFDWNAYCRQHWLLVIVSVFLGASSHLLWDGLTHHHGFFAGLFPVMVNGVSIMGTVLTWSRVLQHISTFIGGLVVIWAVASMPVVDVERHQNPKYWPLVFSIVAVLVVVRFSLGVGENIVGEFMVTFIPSIVLALAITPFLLTEKLNA